MDDIVEHLAKAERPLIIAGNGVIISEAWEALTRFAESLSIPVVTTLGGKGAISEDHKLAVGVIGRYSRHVANESVREADAVLVIGTQLGGLATNAWALPLGDKPLFHIDTNPEVIGHNYRTAIGVIADAKLALEQALAAVERGKLGKTNSAWAKALAERVAVWREHAAALAKKEMSDGIHPAAVIAELRKIMGPNDLLAADTGAIAAWAGTLFPNGAGRTVIRSTGSLGWVVPGALGAALARPDRRTVALSGDGGLLYHIGELETAVRCQIPLVIVVINNRAFGSEHHLLKHRWGGRDIPEVVDFSDADFAAIARGFGAFGIRVDKTEDIAGALKQAFAANKPALVDIRTSKEAEAPAESYRGNSVV
jgi:acetolactate synthase-1/2/3 large subunit